MFVVIKTVPGFLITFYGRRFPKIFYFLSFSRHEIVSFSVNRATHAVYSRETKIKELNRSLSSVNLRTFTVVISVNNTLIQHSIVVVVVVIDDNRQRDDSFIRTNEIGAYKTRAQPIYGRIFDFRLTHTYIYILYLRELNVTTVTHV